MSHAPMGFKNRCRIVKMVYDIEQLDEIEAKDPTVVKDGELVHPHKLKLGMYGISSTTDPMDRAEYDFRPFGTLVP